MQVILSVDALKRPLTGIGRYTWELATRLHQCADVSGLQFYCNGHWVDDLECILDHGRVAPRSLRVPKHVRRLYWAHAGRRSVFHSPNFLLPPQVANGISTVHDLSVLKFPDTHPAERVRQFERSFLTTLGVAKHIITPSETVRREVMEYFGWPAARITAIHNGVPAGFAPKDPIVLQAYLQQFGLLLKRYTICVSTIEPRKRVDRLIRAYRALPQSIRSNVPLVLVGDKGWRSEDIHEEIEQATREGWLHYLGFVDEAAIPYLYAGAMQVVYPSIYEGFGLPVAEAMACGVPVITSNQSCLPEIAAGAAALVDPDDQQAFTETLERCLTDEGWREQARTQGLQTATRYSWDVCAARTVEVYRSLDIG